MADLNGASKSKRVVARAQAQSSAADPMSRVLATGPRIPVTVAVAVAVFLHVGMAAGATAVALFDEIFAWQKDIRQAVDAKLSQYEVDVVKEPEKPPEPEPEKPPEPEPEKPPPAPKDDTPPPPPPAPAEAAKVLTSDPDPNEPVDLTNTFVSGTGSTFAGGVTSANGTSKTAVYNPAATPTGVPGGTGTAPAPPPPGPKVDRSRAAKMAGSADWNCPFPAEADADQIDDAYVTIKVKLKIDGSPESVTVLQDPGHGFGREAKKCAMGKRWEPPLDQDGNAFAGSTNAIRVHFQR